MDELQRKWKKYKEKTTTGIKGKRRTLHVNISKDLFFDFRRYCDENCINISKFIEKMIWEKIKNESKT